MIIDLKAIGSICGRSRRIAEETQLDVSKLTGYSQENICSFENGRTNNAALLLFYMKRYKDTDSMIYFLEGFKGDQK